ncbi:hypothetical protein CC1G_00605 [Coprinopsis cinerea okayama7|uniref:Uncharacterized protein n=1 Tax=Coprinopsis cinerea (strain Okayama-7 / 130 / ATCC MYA-4618 / FGSC 9003) TaxID=240176 RepID=A8N3T4_COPC7|nr:hypothetical protein CC1G_00605 [Coprinopsis cinerea okayama7\|eukprot:XP_001829426.2 hypothetical protein CC1G_00605 [Coprinopsis cinerea okayama7\
MSRPKKYATKAERKAANREKNKRYYAKNKDEINKRRKETRASIKARDRRQKVCNKAKASVQHTKPVITETEDSRVKISTEAALAPYRAFKCLVGDAPFEYHNSFCKYLIELAKQGEDWRNEILSAHQTLLQVCGIGPEFRKVDAMLKDVQEAIANVEDIEVHLLGTFDDFLTAFQSGYLLFQK